MAMKTLPATSKDVRVWFKDNPTKVPEGAHKSVQTSCKGRINSQAIDVFNKHADKHGMKYREGQEPTVAVTYKARNHRMVTTHLERSKARAMAGKSGTKGPLSKADLARVAEALAAN